MTTEKQKDTLFTFWHSIISQIPKINPKDKSLPKMDPYSHSMLVVRAGVTLVSRASSTDFPYVSNPYYTTDPQPPARPGVYAFWSMFSPLYKKTWASCLGGIRPVYVGQAANLANRTRPDQHERFKEILNADALGGICLVTWGECDIFDLDFVECSYISILRPFMNFGKNAKWRKSKHYNSARLVA